MRAGTETSLRSATIDDALGRSGGVFVDLRSGGEYAQDHVPGAHSIPLFDDDERALIGTLYAKASPEVAFDAAAEATRARIEDLVHEVGEVVGWTPPVGDLVGRVAELTAGGIRELERRLGALEPGDADAPVFLYCWRGQLRSRSVTAFLSMLGLERATIVEGGYKAYRGHVMRTLEGWEAPPAIALRGWTGVGKTLVLRELERQRPGWTLDLELAAGHRSSILGMVGLEPVSQRRFESRLAARLTEGFPGGVVVLEGESRKVGDAIQPPRVWDALQGATNVRLVAPVERRVRVLAEDYLATEASRAQLAEQLPFIEQRLGRTKYAGALVALLEADRIDELVELLLEKYYDPLYEHSEKGRAVALELDASDVEGCARAVAEFVDERRDRSS